MSLKRGRRNPSRFSKRAYVRIARELSQRRARSTDTPLTKRYALAVLAAYRAGPAPAAHIAARLNRHEVPHPTGALWGHREVVAALQQALSIELAEAARLGVPAMPPHEALVWKGRRGVFLPKNV